VQSLPRGIGPVAGQGDAGDVAGHIGGEKDGGARDVLGCADAPERDARRPPMRKPIALYSKGSKRSARNPQSHRAEPEAR
jgi:hypothetical protein